MSAFLLPVARVVKGGLRSSNAGLSCLEASR